jgi:hypothetical protein
MFIVENIYVYSNSKQLYRTRFYKYTMVADCYYHPSYGNFPFQSSPSRDDVVVEQLLVKGYFYLLFSIFIFGLF